MTKDPSYLVVLIVLAVVILAVGIFAYVKSDNARNGGGRHHHHHRGWGCRDSRWGCCPDGITTKQDQWGSNCSGGHRRDRRYGGDRDRHGCIKSAGYRWCHSLGRCIRPWEQSCP